MEYVQVAINYLESLQIEPVLRPIKEIKVDRKLIFELAAAGLVGYSAYYLGFVDLNIFFRRSTNKLKVEFVVFILIEKSGDRMGILKSKASKHRRIRSFTEMSES